MGLIKISKEKDYFKDFTHEMFVKLIFFVWGFFAMRNKGSPVRDFSIIAQGFNPGRIYELKPFIYWVYKCYFREFEYISPPPLAGEGSGVRAIMDYNYTT